MDSKPLPKPPPRVSTASQSLCMGLEIGDTIVGRETHRDGSWNERELTLRWRGISICVWRVRNRSSRRETWSEAEESTNWTLGDRDWFRVPHGPLLRPVAGYDPRRDIIGGIIVAVALLAGLGLWFLCK